MPWNQPATLKQVAIIGSFLAIGSGAGIYQVEHQAKVIAYAQCMKNQRNFESLRQSHKILAEDLESFRCKK